jgi:ABC-type branched-subunit amino acid transport system permease subunit
MATPLIAVFLVATLVPFVSNDYWVLIATRAAIYWVLVAGLNLMIGFAGQLAIGYVALLTLGAYTTSVLAGGNVLAPLHPFVALAIAGIIGAVFGVIVGLPALRLRTFYFAISTLGFATIVTQIALAWQSVTGGGIGLPGPEFPAPLNTHRGLYYFCLGIAAVCTWMTVNIAMPTWRPRRRAFRSRACSSTSFFLPARARLWREACSRACKPTSRRTPSASTSPCCSSLRC